jgi:iron complex outermembrane recepter protein
VGNYDLGALPAVKFNAAADWHESGWNIGAVLRFVGSFRECAAGDAIDGYTASGGLCYAPVTVVGVNGNVLPNYRDVGAVATVDLHASYVLQNPIGKTQFMLGINNVFNQDPPYVFSAPLANSDAATYDFLGRYFYGRIQHTF